MIDHLWLYNLNKKSPLYLLLLTKVMNPEYIKVKGIDSLEKLFGTSNIE